MCAVCTGRGEVEAGLTGGTVEYGPEYDTYDWRGNVTKTRAVFPTAVQINPAAWDWRRKEIWFLDYNQLCPLWSTAICYSCRGTGMSDKERGIV